MKADDLFDVKTKPDKFGLGILNTVYTLKIDLVLELTKASRADINELELAKALLTTLRDDLVSYGTNGVDMRLDDETFKTVLRLTNLVLKRNNLPELSLPFRDFSGFGDYWSKEGMSGGGKRSSSDRAFSIYFYSCDLG